MFDSNTFLHYKNLLAIDFNHCKYYNDKIHLSFFCTSWYTDSLHVYYSLLKAWTRGFPQREEKADGYKIELYQAFTPLSTATKTFL